MFDGVCCCLSLSVVVCCFLCRFVCVVVGCVVLLCSLFVVCLLVAWGLLFGCCCVSGVAVR